jgi:hypothetical protein
MKNRLMNTTQLQVIWHAFHAKPDFTFSPSIPNQNITISQLPLLFQHNVPLFNLNQINFSSDLFISYCPFLQLHLTIFHLFFFLLWKFSLYFITFQYHLISFISHIISMLFYYYYIVTSIYLSFASFFSVNKCINFNKK